MKENLPQQTPKTKKDLGLIIDYKFSETRMPIFWGPNQVIAEDGIYVKPTGWKPEHPLQIPRVGRFIYDRPAESPECPNPITRVIGASGFSSSHITDVTTVLMPFNWTFFYSPVLTPYPIFKNERWRIVRTLDSTILPGEIVQQGIIDADGRFIGLNTYYVGGFQLVSFESLMFTFSEPANSGPASLIAYVLQWSCGGIFHDVPSENSEYSQGVLP